MGASGAAGCDRALEVLEGLEGLGHDQALLDVLAVQRRDVERCGLLGRVRMLGALVDAQVAELLAAERAARQHALDGLLDDALGEAAFEDRTSRCAP